MANVARVLRERIGAVALAGLAAVVSSCAAPDVAGSYRLDLVSHDSACPDRDIADRLDNVELEVLQDGRDLNAELRVIPVLAEVGLVGETTFDGVALRSVDTYSGERVGTCRMTYAYRLSLELHAGGRVTGTLVQEGANPASGCAPARCRATWEVSGARSD
ncbi:MAG TPA: hypothetical protein VG389_28430 [Myxococcota bacterium]|jgi:hypothetical protein|nr:hypothetical protein [Myxococcota bacterium]